MSGEARSWLGQALSGLALLAFGLWHMLRVHYEGSVGGLPSYEEAVAVFKDPFSAALAVAFTVTVAFHAFNGVKMVLVEAGVDEARASRAARLLWAATSIYVAALAVYLWLRV